MFKLILLYKDWISLEVLNFSLERPCKFYVLTSRIVLKKDLFGRSGLRNQDGDAVANVN